MNTVRTVDATAIEIIPISRPFSMFDFAETRFPGLGTIRRILSQIRSLHGITMVVEELEPSAEIAEENEDLEIRYQDKPSSRVTRLSFFSKEFTTPKGLATATSGQFLGYAVVKEDFVAKQHCVRIYESVLRPSSHPNNCVRRQPLWKCCINGNALEIEGYLYAQQNDMTNVCAHVALRSAVSRFHKEGDISYREINKTVGIDHVTRKAGGADGGGLSLGEMVKVLENAGARCVTVDYQDDEITPANVPFHKYIYGSVESGFPALLAFGTHSGSGHVIPVFGHTFNQDTWVCNAESSYFKAADLEYIPSESWLSMYLAHDDNFGSNYCIPRRYLHAMIPCAQKEKPEDCPLNTNVAGVIGTLPWEVKLMPITAEVIGAQYLFTILPQMEISDAWDARLKFYAEHKRMVLRPILVTKKEYLEHLKCIHDWDDKQVKRYWLPILKKYLVDEYYWLIELSLPELFSANRRKVGEVLLRAENKFSGKLDFTNFALARLPEQFALYESGGIKSPKYSFIPSGIHGHVELFGCKES